MEEKKVYLVYPERFAPQTEYGAIFSSKEDAEAYARKYKENTDFVIKEEKMDTAFHTSQTQSAYGVWLDCEEDESHDVWLEDYGTSANDASQNKYEFFKENINSQTPRFMCFLLASSEEEALALAKQKRDELLASGKISISVPQS